VATDWLKLRNEYLQSDVSLRKLAEIHGVCYSTLKSRAARERWAQARRDRQARQSGPPANERRRAARLRQIPDAPPITDGSDGMAQLKAIRDQLTAQLARATGELDKQIVRHRRKTREICYDDQEAAGKPVLETVEERVLLEVVDAPVDSMSLKRLSATLKILRDVTREDGDGALALARVEDLMNRLDAEAGKEDAP
jgi:hypothetical protein